MFGTVRSFRPGQREEVLADIRRIGDGIAAAFGVAVEMETLTAGLPTINTKAEGELAMAAAVEAGLPVRRGLPPSAGGEDFGRLLAHKPGAFVWIGNGPADSGRELHSPYYDFNDEILPAAATWLAFVAKHALAE
jgi:hippurate hydrolase